MTQGGRRLSFDIHLLSTLAVASTLLAIGLASPARADETFGIAAPARSKEAKPPAVPPSSRFRVDVGGSPLVVLEPMDNRTLRLQDDIDENQRKILRIGVAREVTVRAEDGAWTQLADGSRLWTAEVVSPNAIALRLHFADLALPAGAELAVYGVDGGSFGAPAAGVPEVLRGGQPLASHWSGTVSGERARIEYLAPAGTDAAALPFRVDQLQHIYRDPIAEEGFQEKAAGPCHNDVTCFPDWAGEAASVARYSIIFPSGIGLCTGQLINNQAQDFTPYFLTANHCISDGFEAAGTEFFWFYQTSTCGGAPPSLGSVPRSQGATLISTNAISDYTLLQVEGALPDGLFWSGWTSVKPGLGVDAASIHHPEGDYKRISFGFNDTPALCPANHVTISWTDGPTEPGSSGSGVFRDDTHQLFGQLHGGPSACGNETFDCYGAFSTTYGKIKKLLKSGSDDSSDPNDSCSKPRTVKTGTLSNRIVKVNDTDWYRYSVPAGKTVVIHLDFANSDGDIDLAAFGSCGDDPVATSRTTGDSEEVSVTNVGSRPAFVIWQVYLYSDVRNNYNQTVSIQ
ncbi:MAG TPA: trypsin-like peptidase domain-containing protein [Thermoanaerobaculia bacterium]|jgi:hypothetical protein|nr:trypsin-like peptidase domain-containing protein [Thermoanaerobaculia bacterium]